MNKRQMTMRVQEIRARFKEMADKLESEKRVMTPEEQEERKALDGEIEVLQLRLNQMERGWQQTDAQATAERAFTDAVVSLHRKAPAPEGTEAFLRDGTIEIPLNRAAAIQDTASVAPIVPLTIADIIEPLEKGLILDKLGMKFQYGMVGTWQYPVIAGGIEATLMDENAEVGDTKIDFTKLVPEPKRVSLKIPLSNRAIDQSNTMILEVVRKQMSAGLARLLNRWMFNKVKITAKASEGCFVSAYANPAVTFAEETPTWAEVLNLESSVLETGVEVDNTAAFVCTASMLAKLKAAPKDKGSGRFIVEDGKIDGYPVYTTEYVEKDMLGFGVFNYELVGQFGQMRMIYDPYTGAGKNLVYFVLNTDFDLLTLRSEAFAVGKTENVGE